MFGKENRVSRLLNSPYFSIYFTIYKKYGGYMEYLSITFPKDLKQQLDSEAKREHIKRSTLIQKAVRIYLQLKKKQETNNLLREGYREMYGLSQEIMIDFEKLDSDSLKYVD